MRVIVLSHGHPELGAGGAERAAYSLFQRMKKSSGVERAFFVARAEAGAIGHSAYFGSFRGREDEILVSPPDVEAFTFQSLGYDLLKQLVTELIDALKPDVVHIHHFVLWGVEIFELFKSAGVRVVFTIHEYAAICANFGQMVKTGGELCYAASPAECATCFPSMSAGKFFVRSTILKSFLAHVDQLISPSEFLKKRYVDWGVSADRILVVENLLDEHVVASAGNVLDRSTQEGDEKRRVVFGYFGQINPFKGIDILLEATAMLPEELRPAIEVRIHGDNKHFRDTSFGERIETLFHEQSDVVRRMGPYRNEDVINLMQACDVIVVPSIWWENSPVVIQEARIAGRPLICSDLGGMAEKIDRSVDYLFLARSPGALSEVLGKVVGTRTKQDAAHLKKLANARLKTNEVYLAHHFTIYSRKSS
ncbi:glycosyltransferase [Microvirga sp. 2MCAF38]|uniref:glycosyltransferase n=1 Tax=Microvirga sp. 2MCAF38 TaxID=3232989 RepID=UPI003F9DD762